MRCVDQQSADRRRVWVQDVPVSAIESHRPENHHAAALMPPDGPSKRGCPMSRSMLMPHLLTLRLQGGSQLRVLLL